MLSVQVTDIKECMSRLLKTDSFDRFYLVETSITMGISYSIDGHRNPAFFDSEEAETDPRSYCFWQEVRPLVFQLIRGKRQPVRFRAVLAFPEKTVDFFLKESRSPLRPEDLEGIYINFLFEPGKLLITTGISSRVFSMDRSLEHCVDDHVRSFLRSQGIQ